jgi:hypothetical protein
MYASPPMIGNWKRILAGLVAALLVERLLGYFVPIIELTTFKSSGSELGLSEDFSSWMIRGALVGSGLAIIAFAVGGFVAQRKFLVPALVLVVAQYAYGVWQGLALASGSVDASDSDSVSLGFIELLQVLHAYGFWADAALPTLLTFVLPTAATAVGSILGMKLFELQRSRSMAEQRLDN